MGSAFLLGFYDVAKKQALKRNGVMGVLFLATSFSALFMSPFLTAGTLSGHLLLIAKAFIVSISWISGLAALKLIPLTTASTIKASRPVLVLIFSIVLFGERLSLWQWAGVLLAVAALFLLSRTSKNEGIEFSSNKGIFYMAISVISGAGSALYDKYILTSLQPLFVQSWTNIYIAALLGLIIAGEKFLHPGNAQKFKWDWNILVIAVLITVSDCLYFFAVKEEGSLLSVISLIRRGSVIITFALGAVLFKENNIRPKAISLGILLAGLVLLVLVS